MFYNFLLSIIFISVLFTSNAQHTNIKISDLANPNEPSISINPFNTNAMVAGANINSIYYSDDGGYTWQHKYMSSDYGVWGDPCIISGSYNEFYYFHLSNPVDGNWIDRIVCQKSADGGVSWNSGTYMGLSGTKAQDKEWAVFDQSTKNIYVTWTQFDDYGSSLPEDKSVIKFAKSVDFGETWSPAKTISQKEGDCVDDDNTTEGAVPCVGPNGEIYVSWSVNDTIYFDRSLDEGDSWIEEDIAVSDMPGGWAFNIPGIIRCNGMPVTACDTSGGSNNGTIYINWADQRNGEDDTDIFLSKSEDGGLTWSPAKRVNDDEPGHQQFFTWMTIDQVTGYLYFVFYDRRRFDTYNTDVFMAVSKDGGESFTNFRISESSFVPTDYIFFGDYTNVTAYNNVVRPIWTRLQNGQLSLWTAIIDVNSMNNVSEERIPFVVDENYPNPFSYSTYFSFNLRKKSLVNVIVYNELGQKIGCVLDNQILNTGKYIYELTAEEFNLKQGIYYVVMTSEGQKLSRKIIYFE